MSSGTDVILDTLQGLSKAVPVPSLRIPLVVVCRGDAVTIGLNRRLWLSAVDEDVDKSSFLSRLSLARLF